MSSLGQWRGRVLDELDDLLALVGFGARHVTACLVVRTSSQDGEEQAAYRGDRSVPAVDRSWDWEGAVIAFADFQEFLKEAYPRYMATGPHELIRQALHLVQLGERTVETRFVTLFAALETLVLWYRKGNGLEVILDDAEWGVVREDMQGWLKAHPLLKGAERANTRALIYSKLAELRRVPFSAAWEAFCREYSVGVGDLWPLDGSALGISLTGIRNRLVHGQAFSERGLGALGDACDHMRWTVERALLAVLGWPLERSRLRPDYLRMMTAVTGLAEARGALRDDGENRRREPIG